MAVPPDSNWTDPAGWLASEADSVAVSVTVAPTCAGFGEAIRFVVVDNGPAGPEELVVYVLPSAEMVRNSDCSGSEVPVRPDPEKQNTTISSVPPLARPATDWIVEMGSSSVPENGPDRPALTAADMLKVAPPPSSMRRTAEPWNPLAHPWVVAQVGVLLAGPVVGFSARVPGFLPTPAALAAPAPNTMAPAVAVATPRNRAARPSRPTLH